MTSKLISIATAAKGTLKLVSLPIIKTINYKASEDIASQSRKILKDDCMVRGTNLPAL